LPAARFGTPADVSAFLSLVMAEAEPATDRDAVRVIPVRGALTHGAWWSDYDDLRAEVGRALEDASIRAIVLDINSPGGTVSGMRGIHDFLRASRATKPIVALAADSATSAAYAIASSASKILTTPSGIVGSIGVMAMHVDYSAELEKLGINVTEIASGSRKLELSPYRPLSKTGRSTLEMIVGEAAADFFAMVREARGVDAARFEGALFTASAAIENGLADAIGSLDAAIETAIEMAGASDVPKLPGFSSSRPSAPRRAADTRVPMSETPATPAPSGAEIVDLDAVRREAEASGRTAAQLRATEVSEACQLAGLSPAATLEYVTGSLSASEVRADILRRRAAGAGPELHGQRGAAGSGDEHPVTIDTEAIYEARRRAMASASTASR
jgi:signal peptide peptidase SppA